MKIKNMEASVKARLKIIAKKSGRNFDSVLLQYFQERFLYRLSISPYKENFILKGALLFLAYEIPRSRPTKDIDFLGKSLSNTSDCIIYAMKEILEVSVQDGLRFDLDSLIYEVIKQDADYKGIRLFCNAYLGSAFIRLHFDIGFGDIVIPQPVILDFPVLLSDSPVPELIAYTPESAIAEKFEAIVNLGLITSRMKDFFDIYYLSEHKTFKSETLTKAIKETFKRRNTKLSNRITIYQDEFKYNENKQIQWKAFLRRQMNYAEITFFDCIDKINEFIEPIILSDDFKTWNPNDRKWI